MKILVGNKGGEADRLGLLHAKKFAKENNAFVYIMNSMEGGKSEKQSDILKAEENLDFAWRLLEKEGLEYRAFQSVVGLSAGEDIIRFAKEKNIDHIFLGIKKKSTSEKVIMGSTAKYVILNALCPVTTIRFEVNKIGTEELLTGRRILAVDDEPDVLESIEEILDMSLLDTAGSFDQAKELIRTRQYDIAILDIMGVKGYELLLHCRKKGIPALMLTAHALNPDNLLESIRKGADSYILKEELMNLPHHVEDLLKRRIKGEKGLGAWFKKLTPLFDKSFGKGWRDKEKEFWDSVDDKHQG